ncbi:MAG: alkylation response protein AidB-like acyl-CoA dehydrogenase [Gammaproteobacteria bacterium]|jgi:alkylation response protein AidB-like acyl-CoA dehydrogenase
MCTNVGSDNFDAAAIAPVRFGTPEMDDLIKAIGQSATASKAMSENPFSAIDLVRASRLGALRVPVADGGGGSTVREFFAMLLDLAEADSDVAQILRAHFWFVEERLRGRDPAVRDRWIKHVVAGEIVGNAMTEIGGSEPVGSFTMHTQLLPNGERYLLNGTKYFCTGSLYSDWVWVLTSTPDGEVTAVVVPIDRAGVALEDDWDGIGQRFTGSGTGRFNNVIVNPEEVLRMPLDSEGDNGEKQIPTEPFLIGQFVQLILTTIIVGNLRNVLSDAVRIVGARKRTFTHASANTTASDPQYQEMIGRISSTTFAAESTILAAAEAHQAALDSVKDGQGNIELAHRASMLAAQAKVFVDDVAPRAASLLFELGGASSTGASSALDRHWRNIVTLSSHNSTAFKARAIGDYLLNETHLPMNGYF